MWNRPAEMQDEASGLTCPAVEMCPKILKASLIFFLDKKPPKHIIFKKNIHINMFINAFITLNLEYHTCYQSGRVPVKSYP